MDPSRIDPDTCDINEEIRTYWFIYYGILNDLIGDIWDRYLIANKLHNRDIKLHPELHKVTHVNHKNGWEEYKCSCGYSYKCDSSD